MASVEYYIFQWVSIIVLVSISGLFAGLTLGIMSLDITGLEIIIASGTPKESKYAKIIYPVRQRGNLLLCTLLLGNVGVNALLSIFLADLTSGFVGFILSTVIIVIAGEIIPQAACSRYGLAVGAHTIYIVYLFIFLFFPFAYPISKTLDWILGNEMGTIYSRQQLKKLLDIHSAHANESGVSRSDVTMLTGVLDFAHKKVSQVMTPLDKVYSVDIDSILDYNTITLILERGHSRIPVFEKTKSNITGCLYIKDLALINPADKVPLRTIVNLYKRQLVKTWDDTSLDQMLTEFKTGRSHMAIVHKVNNEGEGDPFYENLGIICLEDIIEEILQDEILDENDIYHDSRKKNQDHSFDYRTIGSFHGPKNALSQLSTQQVKALYAYLSGSIDEFSSRYISETEFIKMLSTKGAIVLDIEKPLSEDKFIYSRGVVSDFFTVILSGKIEIRSGSEGFISEGGQFCTLGVGALRSDNFMPDFTARVLSNNVQILKIPKNVYDISVISTDKEYNTKIFNRNRIDLNTSPQQNTTTTTTTTSTLEKSHSRAMSGGGEGSQPNSTSLKATPYNSISPSINPSLSNNNKNNSSGNLNGLGVNGNNNSGHNDNSDSEDDDDYDDAIISQKPILSNTTPKNNNYLHNIRKSDSNV
ncbi:hypothetical protein DICPUDRAFT_97440 [Dictyostelium purpureum]|uniref:CNNM transmembrane domain-containing protein n=1 Tax=Dictyostelium purpureum TaxID=5786 RepID=F0ZGQ5_DICPU|nr:uncharacterized protein DICPUDRAFT_97440 [Dictyostelium purpureum]EGC36866.1 hypothetical protein DICPUDRAFT_97440 [Dictyostelium purpureum]|eukprot:XP_003286588.1 hypothetical protein DICPUDRAFT_97440 [Dictyostelium purpureum]